MNWRGVNPIANFFDIATTCDHDRAQVRVFEVATGKKVFDLKWDPRHYNGADIKPALSPSGRRVALVRLGKLLVYQIP